MAVGNNNINSNRRPQSQDPMRQRDRRTMWRTRVQGRKARDRIEEGGGGAEKHKKPQKRAIDVMWKAGKTRAVGEKDVDKAIVGLADVDPGYLENRKEAKGEAQGAQGLRKNRRENMSPLSLLWTRPVPSHGTPKEDNFLARTRTGIKHFDCRSNSCFAGYVMTFKPEERLSPSLG